MASESTKLGALRWILLATAVAGLLGYLIQLAAPRLLDGPAYVAFSVMWSTIYLCVAAMSGVQQEVTRASRSSTTHRPNTVLRTFTLAAAGVVLVLAVVLGIWLSLTAVPMASLSLTTILGVAFVGYLANAVLSGVLYGVQAWRGVALVTILDAVLRALLLGIGLVGGAEPFWLGLGIAFPFGLSFTLGWLILRRNVIGRFALDVDARTLSKNVASTVGSAACSGVMISGLPLLLGVTSPGVPAASLGALIMAINLTRAPIVVPVMALQSYLISAVFRDRDVIAPRRLFGLIAIAIAAMIAISALAFAVGPWLIGVVSGGTYSIDPFVIATVVLSAGLVALLCVTGPALVAEGRHTANVTGWVVAASLTVGCLILPIEFAPRTLVALTLPAIAGLILHTLALLRGPAARSVVSADGLPG